jgi:cell division transport system permease protein
MKILKIYRTIKEGGKNFARNGWLSFAAVSVMVLSLYIMSITVFLGFSGRTALDSVENQLNISVYFAMDVKEERVLAIKDELLQFQEIEQIDFVSRDIALERLLETDGENEDISKALEEIGENPLPHSLVIYATHPNQYVQIDTLLKNSSYAQEIDVINYDRNKATISSLHSLLSALEKIGLATGIVFLIISILITFNAIRLTLYSQRREFEIMRLVGASNLYIRLPSLVEGILYGLVASVVTLTFLGLTAQYLIPISENFLGQGVAMSVVLAYWWVPVVGVPAIGIFLGIVSSWIAISKYLKI